MVWCFEVITKVNLYIGTSHWWPFKHGWSLGSKCHCIFRIQRMQLNRTEGFTKQDKQYKQHLLT